MLAVELIHHHARLPNKAYINDAGYDLYSCENKVIESKSFAVIRTGIKLNIPSGYYGRIASRSGLAVKYNIEVGAGVIDNEYRGEIMVKLHNHGHTEYNVKIGDKIAQLILELYGNFPVVLVDSVEQQTSEITSGSRGTSGFGSSG